MKAAGKSIEIYRYDAEHAFANEQRVSVHDRKAAELAWGPRHRVLQEAFGLRGLREGFIYLGMAAAISSLDGPRPAMVFTWPMITVARLTRLWWPTF